VLHQTDAVVSKDVPEKVGPTLFENVTASVISGDIIHKENFFIDFDKERLIPKMISTEGPKLAIGDVNNDGLSDFFMGGAKGDTAKLFLQEQNGHFKQVFQSAFVQDKDYEDVDAQFVDVDNDGDLDLVVASGGNEEKLGSLYTLPRLYLNDGKGNFKRTLKGWPSIFLNASCVRACDFDGDGDQDIFIGARNIPGQYGMPPSSALLENDGKGNFRDVTQNIALQLKKLGMITDAQWADIDGDGKKELIVVGDWMSINIFKYSNNKLERIEELPNSAGWWNCITAADIDGDGDIDFVAGNYGLNSKIKADEKHQAELCVGDFDDNGTVECIPAYYKTDGKLYPFNLRSDLVMQLPQLKKKFLRYDSYAGKTLTEVFTPNELQRATILKCSNTQTSVFINDGKGHFKMEALPVPAQLSPVFGILVTDINGDGVNDIFLGGNFYGLKPEVGRLDASYGCTLLGSKQNKFTFVPPAQSGLLLKGEVRDIREVKTKNGNDIVVARNNDSLLVFHKR
jgi:hypothetical protein